MKLVKLKSTTSTMDVAKKICKEHPELLEEGVTIVAESQTDGRGREGRSWVSNKGGLYYSLLCRPRDLSGEDDSVLLNRSAMLVCQVVRSVTGVTPILKQPNDIYLKGAKLGGVLLESGLEGNDQGTKYLIVGVGLNVNQRQVASSLLYSTTSISMVTEKEYDLAPFYSALTARFLKDLSF